MSQFNITIAYNRDIHKKFTEADYKTSFYGHITGYSTEFINGVLVGALAIFDERVNSHLFLIVNGKVLNIYIEATKLVDVDFKRITPAVISINQLRNHQFLFTTREPIIIKSNSKDYSEGLLSVAAWFQQPVATSNAIYDARKDHWELLN